MSCYVNTLRYFTLFTQLRIENTQSTSSSSLITAHGVGVLNEQRCKC